MLQKVYDDECLTGTRRFKEGWKDVNVRQRIPKTLYFLFQFKHKPPKPPKVLLQRKNSWIFVPAFQNAQADPGLRHNKQQNTVCFILGPSSWTDQEDEKTADKERGRCMGEKEESWIKILHPGFDDCARKMKVICALFAFYEKIMQKHFKGPIQGVTTACVSLLGWISGRKNKSKIQTGYSCVFCWFCSKKPYAFRKLFSLVYLISFSSDNFYMLSCNRWGRVDREKWESIGFFCYFGCDRIKCFLFVP